MINFKIQHSVEEITSKITEKSTW